MYFWLDPKVPKGQGEEFLTRFNCIRLINSMVHVQLINFNN